MNMIVNPVILNALSPMDMMNMKLQMPILNPKTDK